MDEEAEVYRCLLCGRRISKEEYETFDGLCQECYEIEISELDFDIDEDD
jgi:NMD protein affecting ribosome stability and mRNA decay